MPRHRPERKLLAERVFGYFWMFKDLELTKEKPLLGNEGSINGSVAKRFSSLGGNIDSRGTLPGSRAMVPTAQCTLVTVCHRDFGNQMLPFMGTAVQGGNVSPGQSSVESRGCRACKHPGGLGPPIAQGCDEVELPQGRAGGGLRAHLPVLLYFTTSLG